MRITIKTLSQKAQEEQNDWQDIFRMDINGKEVLTVTGGEPEDNTLGRDLNFVYSLPDLMKLAYEAGRTGEILEFERVKLGDKEEIWS